MQITQLIKELEKVQADLGDVPVWYFDLSTGGYKVIDRLEVKNFVVFGTQKILILI